MQKERLVLFGLEEDRSRGFEFSVLSRSDSERAPAQSWQSPKSES